MRRGDLLGARVTPGEKIAADRLVDIRRQETGDGSFSGWLRAVIRREAKAAGVAIVEPGRAAAAAPGGAISPPLEDPDAAGELRRADVERLAREQVAVAPHEAEPLDDDAVLREAQAKLEQRRREHEQAQAADIEKRTAARDAAAKRAADEERWKRERGGG